MNRREIIRNALSVVWGALAGLSILICAGAVPLTIQAWRGY